MIATRLLPPLAVIAAFAIPAVLLRPARMMFVEDEPALVSLPETYRSPEMTQREREVEACFLEWHERYGTDADMIVRIDIDAEGEATATTLGGPSSPSLKMCVEEAILRTQYPIGHTISLDLNIHWASKQLQMYPNLIETRRELSIDEARGKLEELQRERARLLRELAERRARAH